MPVNNAHELYGLALERFVPERTALARTLRDEGQREEAAKIARLPKPSIAAWAVNQLVRTQHREVSELFDAGDALQKAQEDLLSGRSDGDALRQSGLFLQELDLLHGDVFSPPDFLPAFASADENGRKLLHTESVNAEITQFLFDIALHHAHGGHDNDDGEHSD